MMALLLSLDKPPFISGSIDSYFKLYKPALLSILMIINLLSNNKLILEKWELTPPEQRPQLCNYAGLLCEAGSIPLLVDRPKGTSTPVSDGSDVSTSQTISKQADSKEPVSKRRRREKSARAQQDVLTSVKKGFLLVTSAESNL